MIEFVGLSPILENHIRGFAMEIELIRQVGKSGLVRAFRAFYLFFATSLINS